jgi:hypothetical protein
MIAVRRLLAAAGASALALTLFAAPPASAAPGLTITQPEGSKPTFSEPTRVNGREVLVVEGTISADDPIERVDFTFEPPIDNDSPQGCKGELLTSPAEWFARNDDEKGGTFKLELTSPCNRSYALKATIIHQDPLPLNVTAPQDANVEDTFGVAIPPAQVRGLEQTYDPESREVRLTWAANSEPDRIGYYVERSPASRDEFSRIGDVSQPIVDTSFIDPNVGEKQRYRIVAVRKGATPGSTIFARASLPKTSGPDAPAPAAPAPGPAPSAGNSGTGNRSSGSGDSSRPSSRPRNQDNVFEEALPFDPSRTTTTRSSPSLSGSSPEDAAVLTELDGVSEEERRRATFLPVAGGLALIVGAMHLLVLSKQAGEADIPIVASRPPGGGRGVSW